VSNTWLCLPSARPAAEVAQWLTRWTSRGYKVALWRDDGLPIEGASVTMGGEYPGYAVAANALIKHVLERDPECDWVVSCGDDTWPDPNHTADEIAGQCSQHFAEIEWGLNVKLFAFGKRINLATFGVVQPTGDDWADPLGKIIDRIAGSPWIGRSFAERINGGIGPYWPEYRHNWLDEEIMLVAQRLGVFWQRPDLIHFHDHCMRYPGGKWAPHLQWVSEDYRRMKPIFEARKRMGFPGSNPL
jgi:hypothetical protein